MSVPSATNSLINLSHWQGSKNDYRYSFSKTEIDSKVQIVNINVFSHRLEVSAFTRNLYTYFKIEEIAQNSLSDKTMYLFNSTYDRFPKDKNGLCTVEAVQEKYSKWKKGFEQTHLPSPLFYHNRYQTQEELLKTLSEALDILQETDNSIEEIKKYFESTLKV